MYAALVVSIFSQLIFIFFGQVKGVPLFLFFYSLTINQIKMSIVLPHSIDIETALHRKYQHTFAFYKVKTINEILYGYHGKTRIDLCDARVYSEDAEFMRRVYYYHTLTGREELIPRLKLCAQYYSKHQLISYEYPMMVITNTKSLFLRRNKRLRKIQAGEASSDESEADGEYRGDFWEDNPDILGDLDNSSLEESGSYEIEYQFQFDEEEHDIFAESQDQGEECLNEPIRIKEISDKDVSHLIHDMAESIQKPIFEKDQPKKKRASGHLLQNIQNKLEYSGAQSISITPMDQTTLRSSLRLQKGNSSQTSQKDSANDIRGMSYTRLSSTFDNPIIASYKGVGESVTFDTMKEENEERRELESRRKKIREKAEQLLRRVRKQQIQECF